MDVTVNITYLRLRTNGKRSADKLSLVLFESVIAMASKTLFLRVTLLAHK